MNNRGSLLSYKELRSLIKAGKIEFTDAQKIVSTHLKKKL